MTQLSLEIPDVKSALRMPSEPIMRSADIMSIDSDTRYRWTARRAWGAGPCVLWTLLNPSIADGIRDDPTMQRMIGFSYRWGFGSLIVTNIYPFVSSKPQSMRAWRRTWNEEEARASGYSFYIQPNAFNAWIENMRKTNEAMAEASAFVAAWGNGVDPADLEAFLQGTGIPTDTSEHDGFGTVIVAPDWKCLGTTRSGAPTHPLARGQHRVSDDAAMRAWSAPA